MDRRGGITSYRDRQKPGMGELVIPATTYSLDRGSEVDGSEADGHPVPQQMVCANPISWYIFYFIFTGTIIWCQQCSMTANRVAGVSPTPSFWSTSKC
jgi:hypothetical protein